MKRYALFLILCLTTTLVAYSDEIIPDGSSSETVWAADSMWYQSTAIVSDDKIDIFYITSTEVVKDSLDGGVESYTATLTKEDIALMKTEDAFAEAKFGKGDCNFFAPYYHQFTFDAILLPQAEMEKICAQVAAELCQAFDYYMRYKNNGRQFVLVGFSQGGIFLRELLKHMTDEQYSRMVAAYYIGYRLSTEDLQHPHIVAATDETSRGVTVSFNSDLSINGIWPFVTEGAATCINPVNWTTTATPATFVYDGHQHTVAVDTNKNILIVDTDEEAKQTYRAWTNAYLKPLGVNEDCLHHYDLMFYTDYIHDNIITRQRTTDYRR